MRCEWDPDKARRNRLKHGVSFDEAARLIDGPADYLEIYDEEHSVEEDRFIAIGPVDRGVILVCYTECPENVTRIISARMATAAERKLLEDAVRGDDE